MLAAESFGVSKSLLKRSYSFLGKSLADNSDYFSAILFLNKSRAIDPASKTIFEAFVNSIKKFFEVNVEEFSKKDLEEYKQAILPIIEFHKLKYSAHRKIVDSMSHMFRRIDYRIKYEAKDVKESKITYRTQQIHNAIYDDMTFEELQSEFTRIIEPTVRDLLDEKEKEKKKKKEAKSKKIKKNK